jgi:hypothetical protein
VPNRFSWWQTKLKPALSDDSDAGQLISRAEYTSIIQSSWPGNATQAMVDALIQRINNSLGSVSAGSNNTIDFAAVQTIENDIAEYNQSAADVRRTSLISQSFYLKTNYGR